MKITIESTDRFITVETPQSLCAIPGRVWEGKTESGIYVQCVITRIAAPAEADQSQFKAELSEQAPPVAGPEVFPLRMVI